MWSYMIRAVIFFFLLLCCFIAPLHKKAKTNYAALVQSAIFAQSKVMMHDVVNPPAAARYYAYGTLGRLFNCCHTQSALVKPEAFIKNFKRVAISPLPANITTTV